MEYFEKWHEELELHSVGLGEPLQVVFKKNKKTTGVTSTNAEIIQENYKN